MKLYNGDCLKVLDNLISEGTKVDCIITSPPYNMNVRVSNGKYSSRWGVDGNVEEFSCKYQSYKDDLSMEDYFNFQKDFISKALKISPIMFYNTQMVTGNKPALFKLLGEYHDKIKEVFIWDKGWGQPAMQNGILNSQFEFIFVFDKERPYNRAFDKCFFERGTLSNVWSVKREYNKDFKAGFPTELVRKILLNFTNKGDIILDPFMGSGTTGVACKDVHREFIGIELDEQTFEIAKTRIKNGRTRLF